MRNIALAIACCGFVAGSYFCTGLMAGIYLLCAYSCATEIR